MKFDKVPYFYFRLLSFPAVVEKGLGKLLRLKNQLSPLVSNMARFRIWENVLGKSYVKAPFVRMFGGEAGGFNPDLLSGRLEEMLPTIQQVMNNKYFGPTR